MLTLGSALILDINECDMPDKGDCEDECTNYEGGYYCTCPTGYRLMDDNRGCEGTPSFCLGIM